MIMFSTERADMKRLGVLILSLLFTCFPVLAGQPMPPDQLMSGRNASATEKLWTLNQQNADLKEFISQIAHITGDTFVIDPRIKGGNTVTVISSTPMN